VGRNSIWLMAITSVMLLSFGSGPTSAQEKKMELVVTHRTVQVEHVTIATKKKFDDVVAALESSIPQLDPAMLDALAHGDKNRVRHLERRSKLFIFLKRDHGAILRIAGEAKKALQYDIGNPHTATRMTRHQLPAALYAPLRVVLYENADGGATFEYDKPSTLFGQFGDEAVTAVGQELDVELESALRHAAQ
jgi:uncharacterized protein (DUF302 family)